MDVLNRTCAIHQHYLVEASAGTGKTFSIENIFVRLLVEASPDTHLPLAIEQILVVTFTKAATRDLKTRIRSNLEKARSHLALEDGEGIPDYLLAFIERGDEERILALKRVEQALFNFDQAQIFTIHGFCNRMLNEYAFEGSLSPSIKGGDKPLSRLMLHQAVEDFLHTELRPDRWSEAQLGRLLQGHKKNFEELRESLVKILSSEFTAEKVAPFSESVAHFQIAMQSLQDFKADKVLENLLLLAPYFKGQNREKIERFSALFSKNEWGKEDLNQLIADDFFVLQAFHPTNRKKNRTPPVEKLHYPQFYATLAAVLAPFMHLSHPQSLFVRLAEECQSHLKNFLEAEELFHYDLLLSTMQAAVKKSSFVASVRGRFAAAIIDEFQDTDPVQWEIFKELFLAKRLYLVGDPKQSIYAFRQADIYTYLDAAKSLGEKHRATLEVNYRSQPDLVLALNTLFSQAKEWIPLPRSHSFLPYTPVKAGKTDLKAFGDTLGSIHFCFVSEEPEACLFPYIASEIQRLQIPYSSWAILVRDRYQAERTAQYLKERSIPVALQRQENLAYSPVLPALLELIEAVEEPRQENLLKRSLGGLLIGWNHEQMQSLQNAVAMENVLDIFLTLKSLLEKEGLSAFFPAFLDSFLHPDGKTVAERLLGQSSGSNLYDDLCQIVEWVLSAHPHDSLKSSLNALLDNDEDVDQSPKRLSQGMMEGVQILTLHASKGLEFEIVCPLGLIPETKPPGKTLLQRTPTGRILKPIIDTEDPTYAAECAENDAEKMRQLYVSLTRAKRRLYLPVAFSDKVPAPGTASPMRLFLEKMGLNQSERLKLFIEEHPCMSYVECQEKRDAVGEPPFPKASPHLVLAKKAPFLPRVSQYLSSYTSLLHSREESFVSFSPRLSATEEKSVHTLPAGSQMGNILHKLLEAAPLETLLNASSPRDLVPFVSQHLQEKAFALWEEVLAEILFNAFYTPLPLFQEEVPLIAIDPSKQYRETEFLFPWEEGLDLGEVSHVPGFLKGVIDLLFEYKGRYYLLDWKSNRLGTSGEEYKKEKMEQAMREHGYFLQARVYKEALRRYLNLVDPGSFDQKFGGILYLFLRGLKPGTKQGVYLLC